MEKKSILKSQEFVLIFTIVLNLGFNYIVENEMIFKITPLFIFSFYIESVIISK